MSSRRYAVSGRLCHERQRLSPGHGQAHPSLWHKNVLWHPGDLQSGKRPSDGRRTWTRLCSCKGEGEVGAGGGGRCMRLRWEGLDLRECWGPQQTSLCPGACHATSACREGDKEQEVAVPRAPPARDSTEGTWGVPALNTEAPCTRHCMPLQCTRPCRYVMVSARLGTHAFAPPSLHTATEDMTQDTQYVPDAAERLH